MKEQFDSFFLIRFWFQKKTERLFGCLNSQKVLASFCIEWSQSWNVRYLSLVFSLKITACNRSRKNVLFKGTSDQCFNNHKLLLSVDRPSISKHFPSLASTLTTSDSGFWLINPSEFFYTVKPDITESDCQIQRAIKRKSSKC